MLPYFVQNLAGVGGTIKVRPADFVVQEMPAYPASGDGEHVLAEIEKTGLTTFAAIDRLARKLNVPRRDIGYAGLKDANAVTRQWLSVRGSTPDEVFVASEESLKVLYAERHRNKLRVGHLAGNRFSIKIRDVDPMKVVTLTPALATLSRRGMPNYFGPQRFGRRDRNDRIGLALARGDSAEVLRLMLGDANPSIDEGDELAARRHYDASDLKAAAEAWPRRGRDERDALLRLMKAMPPAEVVAKVDRRLRELWESAMQSRLFNAVVARRIESLDGLLDGDLAWKHANGACFDVTDVSIETPRAAAFEISATGPMPGGRMTPPKRDAAEVEKTALVEAGLPTDVAASLYGTADRTGSPNDFWRSMSMPGTRRPLRVRPDELRAESGIDADGPYIAVAFTLPPGAYATVLLRELMRNDTAAGE